MPLPRCFFDISINGVPSGRIIFELFREDCPKTVENFRCLCTGEKGEGRTTFKPLHYKGTPIHRIVKGFIIQGGDFSNGDGTGGESIYGGMFKDEGFKHKHDRPFLLSMANKGQHTNGSQFFITTRPAPHLDGIHVIFGHVISGMPFVTEIENQKVDSNHRPYADIRITHCGELVLVKKGKGGQKRSVAESSSAESSEDEESSSDATSSSDSETDSEEERRRRRRERKKRLKKKRLAKEELKKTKKKKRGLKEKKAKVTRKKDRKKKRKKKKQESSSEESGSEKEPMVTSTVPELESEAIPEDLKSKRPSWLYRRSRTPSPMGGDRDRDRKQRVVTTRQTSTTHNPNVINRTNEVSQSGRKLKGRGQMRYRTPPKFGSDDDDLRNEIQSHRPPPPWRSEGGGREGGRREGRYDDRSRHRSRSPAGNRSCSRSRSRDGGGGGSRRDFHRSHHREEEEERGRRHSPSRGGRWDKRPSRWEDNRHRRFSERAPDSDDERRKEDENRAAGDRDTNDGGRRRKSRFSDHPPPQESGMRGHSRSGSSSEEGRGHRRQHSYRDQRSWKLRHGSSRSPSPNHHRRGGGRRRLEGGGDREGMAMQSKWARHRDQASSGSERSSVGPREEEAEDRELERTYQQQTLKSEEDIFGLDKILS